MTVAELIAKPSTSWKRFVAAGVLVVLALALRDHLLPAAQFAIANLWQITPIVLFGLLVTAILTATGSIGVLVETFEGRIGWTILMVSLIGAVLPVCGITVLPLVAGLLAAGVALPPVMAFLLSSAVTDPQMLAITAATLGWSFAVGKTLGALGIGLFGGTVTLVLMNAGKLHSPTRASSLLQSLTPSSCSGGPSQVKWRFWEDAERVGVFRDCTWTLARLVVFWLSVAFLAEYFLKLYLPEDALASFVGEDRTLAVPLAAIFGAPLYLDGYAALPFVRGLMDRGMADGAAMAFLIAGGITSAWTAIPVFALFRFPVFLTYIILAVIGSMLAGWAYAFAIG